MPRAKLLMAHDWPGNVRELRNAIERAMILEESPMITLTSLPIAIVRAEQKSPAALDRSPRSSRPGFRWRKTSAACWCARWKRPTATRPRPPASCASPAIPCATR